jgi:HAD superfamily hydrolase (TIGR01509 family)
VPESGAVPIADAAALRAVLLDYGGTLDGDAAHWFDHFLALYAECGVALSSAALRPAFYDADARLAAEDGIRDFGLERTVRSHVRYQLERLARADARLAERLADGFIRDTRRAWDRNRPLLRRLAERFRLGVVSNSYGNMPMLLAEARLGPFDVVIDSAVAGIAKPDPAIYALAAERLGVAPGAILHVGDSWERDVVPAAAAGMRTAWLAAPPALMPVSPAPVWRLASLLELEALLR